MMKRGHSAGGGQSSLGYLFGGGGEAAPPKTAPAAPVVEKNPPADKVPNNPSAPAAAPKVTPAPTDNLKQVPAGIQSTNANNYIRADGQNCGNFLTDRRSTKVQAAPGGGSSLGYLFGGADNKS
ncbi:unnamed protein product [Cuscuta campestris]|uniref:Protein SPIRAL1-like 1 n=2 Tax=Cuscuta sect. Cleistogrammica TaxID=1824901 RepID=A0A484JYJ2_9ASTE|nr:hypothetical protein DM860_008530 [Cuscuta australis]VFQ58461.1 unnamed protein product [Cuscuta campestris]